MRSVSLDEEVWEAIQDILGRRANDVASFRDDLEKELGRKINGFPGSVEMALSREVQRLRELRDKLQAPFTVEDEE